MKIVNLIQRYAPAVGGSETWCQEVCRYLVKQGHQVSVLTMNVNREEEFWRDPLDDDKTVAFGRYFDDQGVHVRRYRRSIPIHTVYHLFYKHILDRLLKIYFYGPHSGEMYAQMWREIKGADIVFLHTAPYPHNFLGWVAARWYRKKIVFVPHFHPGHPHYERWSNYLLMKRCHAVITVSEFEKQYLTEKGINPKKLFVTGNGVHPKQYCGPGRDAAREALREKYAVQPDERVVLFLGRKMSDKGVDTLIGAVRGLQSEFPVRLILAGPNFTWFDELYTSLSPEEQKYIIDAGVVSQEEKVLLLSGADLLALPSKYEAFGIVFLEAWICGTPVLGTKEGAMPGVIGKEGFVSTYGSTDDLRITLRTALQNPNRLQRMGSEGRGKVLARYTWDHIGRQVDAALRSVYEKRKVLFCANAYPPNFIGGAELIAHEQAKALRREGCDVAIFAGDPNGALPRHSMRRESYDGLPIWRVVLHNEDYSADFFNFVHRDVEAQFESVLDSFAPDVVHFHNITGLSVGLIHAAKRKNIRTVVTLHDHWGFCLKNTILKTATEICDDFTRCRECKPTLHEGSTRQVPVRMRMDYVALQMKEVDSFITPSCYLADSHAKAGFDLSKFKTIWYGINVKKYSRLEKLPAEGKVRFTFVGYLGDHKGLPVLLRALEILGDDQRVQVNLVGTGHAMERYQEEVNRIGWGSRVKFWGKLENNEVGRVYAQTDIFILPSIWPENQPVTITEAMACGLPVIGSRIGGIPELVDDGMTGFLVEAGDAAGLAERMMNFIRDPLLAPNMGARAAKKMEENTLSRSATAIQAVYENERSAPSKSPNIVVCVGQDIAPETDAIMKQVSAVMPEPVSFVMADWLENDQLALASAAWVVDANTPLSSVLLPMRHGLPVVAPSAHIELRALCEKEQIGLVYSSPDEAVDCLLALLGDNEGRAALIQNAWGVILSPEGN